MLPFGVTALTCEFFGVLYPAYASIKALESPCPEDDKQWLTYWVVYGLLTLAEGAMPLLVVFIPMYYYVKLIGILWLMSPVTKGALYLYESHITPFIAKHEAAFKTVFGTADKMLNNRATTALLKQAERLSPHVIDKALQVAQAMQSGADKSTIDKLITEGMSVAPTFGVPPAAFGAPPANQPPAHKPQQGGFI